MSGPKTWMIDVGGGRRGTFAAFPVLWKTLFRLLKNAVADRVSGTA